ncbi:ABC transporter substrate-binding protein [Spiractinospora alimapuensis]|uniref:heme/hemin ABC transporter substrate-binding protein n=1 Tax=Spiractinospora alimapuensis TaxID=2820884 RepID=UPI001F1D0F65|nr:ABC transporter substrate-binding protein [Spiractinospora alimapuensis]QVQ54199.1 ABC transporter substrate-binding protein [Spiractinospora alimapuensis]
MSPSPRNARRSVAVALLLPVLGLLGCVPTVEPDDESGTASSDVPELAENRTQPLDETADPELPVTVPSVDLDSVASGADAEELTYEDVEVTDTSRILPLTGMIAEVVFTLGLGDNVVGRDAAADFVEAEDLPVVSEGHDVSPENALAQEPTVILADTWTGPPEALDQLQASGIPLVILEEAWTFDDMYPRFERVAEALGVPELGTRLVERTQSQMEEVGENAPTGDPLSVAFLYLRGTAGVYLLGGRGSGADALIEEVGAVDAGVEIGLEEPFTPITTEALISAQPDVLLVMSNGLESVGGVDGLAEIPGIAQTPAGQEGRVIDMPDGVLLNYGPRTPQVVAALAEELYGADEDTDGGDTTGAEDGQ